MGWWEDWHAGVEAEAYRGDALFPGEENLPDGTGGSGRQTYAVIARDACDHAQRDGRLTFCHILEEEACEALAEEDPVKLRAELVQVAAVAAKWVRAIDRRRGSLLT